jgi:hypothetical protein
MTKRISIALAVAAALATSALAPAGAAAATEFGDSCVANDSTEGSVVTLFELASPRPLPTAAPSAGVITKWKVNVVPAPVSIAETMKVLRIIAPGSPGTVLTVGEASGTVRGGSNVFDTRISVQAGDYLGASGSPPIGTLICEEAGPTTIAGFPGTGAATGGTTPFVQLPPGAPYAIPLSAVLEPDADNDGYGDESQDKCPQSAAVQTECPLIVLDSFVLPNRNKAVVLVSTSIATAVTVSGTAKLPKAPKKAGASAKAKLKAVTKSATPGKLNRFTLNFPAALKSAVKSLSPGKSITVKLSASATDVAGRKVTDKAQLKIKG